MSKYIKEVFNDYNLNNNLAESVVENVTLYKNKKTININLASEKQIKLSEIVSFEDYLIKRFSLNNARLEIKYENVSIDDISLETDWYNIISYISRKEPLSKALLRDSSLVREGDIVTINLATKGASLLSTRKFDKGLESLLSNIYNKKFNVKFHDVSDEEYSKRIEEKFKYLEEKAYSEQQIKYEEDLQRIKEEKAEKRKHEREIKKQEFLLKQNSNVQEINNSNQSNFTNIEVIPPEPIEEDVEAGVIYKGRNFPVNGKYAKAEEIKIDKIPMKESTEMKVLIDGEILGGNIESKDYTDKKNGKEKVIVSFNVFDGTSTIGCTVFTDKDKFKELKGKLLDAKGIKVEGTAKYSPYSREVEVMVKE